MCLIGTSECQRINQQQQLNFATVFKNIQKLLLCWDSPLQLTLLTDSTVGTAFVQLVHPGPSKGRESRRVQTKNSSQNVIAACYFCVQLS